MNPKLRLLQDIQNLFHSRLSTIVNFQRGTGDETAVVGREDDRVRKTSILSIERYVDEDAIFVSRHTSAFFHRAGGCIPLHDDNAAGLSVAIDHPGGGQRLLRRDPTRPSGRLDRALRLLHDIYPKPQHPLRSIPFLRIREISPTTSSVFLPKWSRTPKRISTEK